MLGWLYKRIAEQIKAQIDKDYFKELLLEFMNDEDTQAFLLEFTDALYERYKQKMLGTLGGLQKGLNYAQDSQIPDILDSKGRVNVKGLIGMLFANSKAKESQGSLP